MKYILMESEDGMKIPIIFPNLLVHQDVFIVMRNLLHKSTTIEVKLKSAGDINLTEFNCSGKSTTLGVNSLETDKKDIFFSDYGI